MFSDLSDKLFTSEIIEMHGENETNEGHTPNTNQNTSKAGTIEETEPTHPGKTATIKPMLEDLGNSSLLAHVPCIAVLSIR